MAVAVRVAQAEKFDEALRKAFPGPRAERELVVPPALRAAELKPKGA